MNFDKMVAEQVKQLYELAERSRTSGHHSQASIYEDYANELIDEFGMSNRLSVYRQPWGIEVLIADPELV